MPKYNSIENIPAKVFFDILKSENYQLLKPKPKENKTEVLKALFMQIYDDYFIKSENKEAKRYLELTKEIYKLEFKINVIKQILHLLHYYPKTQKMHNDLLKALKDGCGIEIDENNAFSDEVMRVLNVDLGMINTDLQFAMAEFDEMIRKSKAKNYDYFDAIVNLSTVMPNNSLLKESMTLAVYVALEKEAKKISDINKTKNG